MKQFKDLELEGADEHLLGLIQSVTAELPTNWHRDADAEARLEGIASNGKDAGFAFARAATDDDPPTGVFLAREAERYYVSNIVPREPGQLSISQYNKILDEFAEILRDHIGETDDVSLRTTSDEATITDWISSDAADLLERFSVLANMSTGSSHPKDFGRWVEFLIRVHRDNSELDEGILTEWLIEELNWPADRAHKLGSEYGFSRKLLNAYEAN